MVLGIGSIDARGIPDTKESKISNGFGFKLRHISTQRFLLRTSEERKLIRNSGSPRKVAGKKGGCGQGGVEKQ